MQQSFLHPKFWKTWLGMFTLWLISKFPWSIQMKIGTFIGSFLFHIFKKRRFICCVNLEMAFPELPNKKRQHLNKQHFISLVQGAFELAMSWWASERKLKKLMHIEGMEYFENALKCKKGIILLSAHFTSLELGGGMLALKHPLHVVYRPHQNPLIDKITLKARTKRYGKAISRNNIRMMLRSLQQKQVVWYAQDQNFNHKNSYFIDFFNIKAATNANITRLVKLTNAQVVPFFTIRLNTKNEKRKGYLLRFLPILKNFPSNDVEKDMRQINKIIEQQIKEVPEQYLWTHRRYKDTPNGKNRYDSYKKDHPFTKC